MKQLLLLTTIALISTSSFSQLNKNQFIVGGNVSFSSTKFTDYYNFKSKNHELQLTSDVGYFILNKLALGANVGISSYKSQSLYGDHFKFTSNSVDLSPFVRYYVLPKDNKVNFFGQIRYDFSFTKETSSNDTTTFNPYNRTETGFCYAVGPVFFLNPSVALELSLSYNISKDKESYEKATDFLVGVGFQIHLGNKKNKY